MAEPTTPAPTATPPDPYFYIHFSRRLSRCAWTIDRVTGFADALGDTLAQITREYGERWGSRIYLTSHVSQELHALSEEMMSMQVSFTRWRRAEELQRQKEAERRERRREKQRERRKRRGKK
jgi:hypothetical protein